MFTTKAKVAFERFAEITGIFEERIISAHTNHVNCPQNCDRIFIWKSSKKALLFEVRWDDIENNYDNTRGHYFVYYDNHLYHGYVIEDIHHCIMNSAHTFSVFEELLKYAAIPTPEQEKIIGEILYEILPKRPELGTIDKNHFIISGFHRTESQILKSPNDNTKFGVKNTIMMECPILRTRIIENPITFQPESVFCGVPCIYKKNDEGGFHMDQRLI